MARGEPPGRIEILSARRAEVVGIPEGLLGLGLFEEGQNGWYT